MSKSNDELNQIFQLELEGNYELAISNYLTKFEFEENISIKSEIIARIVECWKASGKTNFITFLQKKVQPLTVSNSFFVCTNT